jgi:hypothetical protein
MSRLDHHVAKVQAKMLITSILRALAWSLLVYGGLVWLVIVVTRLLGFDIPRQWTLFYSGLAASVVVAVVLAFVKRPTPQAAAIAIDDRLGLKEKFSTALYARPTKDDPFAAAAVRDAEATAERVHLQDKFPVRWPITGIFTIVMAIVMLLTGKMLQPLDLFGRKAQAARVQEQQRQESKATQEAKKALAIIESAPPAVQKEEKIQLAAKNLKEFLAKPVKDPTTVTRTAQNALEDVKAQAQKIKELQQAAKAMNDMKQWKELSKQPIDESGPVGKAQSELAKGEFTKAIDLLKKTVDNFDKMEQKDKDKAADQMDKLAKQMKAMANDPQAQKDMKDQMQKQGIPPQLAQQMVNKMQQAANGDKQAAQQLQQMANQAMQQMNNGQGPTQQQMQQVQSMLNKMQMQANGQAQAQQMANNAQQLAQAMQQAAQQGKQGNNGAPKQANAGQQNQGQPQGGQGQQNQGNQGQNAQQQMQQQIQQMQAVADAAQQGQGDGQNKPQQGGQPGGQEGGGQQQANAQNNAQAGGGEQGDFQQGEFDKEGGQGGGGGPGRATGRRPDPREAPYAVKQEVSRSDTIEKGKILASNFVKAGAFKGESKAEFQNVTKSNEVDAADEVDQSRVSRQAREAVKEYNRSIQDDAANAASNGK